MAKRFTDTEKYKKPFIRGLQGPYKLLWDYLYHDCDHAGIWIVDFDVAQIYLGADMPVYKKEALKYFNDDPDDLKVIEIDKGKKWFIPSFIEFQYGDLNPHNRAHGSVISILKKYDLFSPDKGLVSPSEGCKDKVKDKDKGEYEGDRSEPYKKMFNSVSKELNIPEDFTEIILTWLKYKSEKGQSYKPTGLKTFIKKLISDTHGNSSLAEIWIDHSMSNNYSGVFPPKEKKHSTIPPTPSRIPLDWDPNAEMGRKPAVK